MHLKRLKHWFYIDKIFIFASFRPNQKLVVKFSPNASGHINCFILGVAKMAFCETARSDCFKGLKTVLKILNFNVFHLTFCMHSNANFRWMKMNGSNDVIMIIEILIIQ